VRLYNGLQASEKTYANCTLTVRDPGGHSSVPRRENAIYRLATALQRVAAYEFPAELSEVTRTYLERVARIEGGELGATLARVARDPSDVAAVKRASESPLINATLRTTCVATRLEGGHADNALPQTARANVNCRILPGHTPEEVRAQLERVVADERVAVALAGGDEPAPASALAPELLAAVENATQATWAGVPVVPLMGTGATDSRYFRQRGVAAYGVSGLFDEIDDVRAHGKDERLPVASFYDGLSFLDRLVRDLAGLEPPRG
jgi:acetylornithine deacetylase/succinyl-diaminopimelate desuccinylase-like protein